MSHVPTASDPRGAPLQSLARLALTLINLVLIVLALALVLGRVVVSQLDHYDEKVNGLLFTWNVTLSEPEGRWQGFRPRVEIGQVTYGGGSISGLSLEVDVLQSLLSGRYIFSHMQWQQAEIGIEQLPAGWRLSGAGDVAMPFDLIQVLRDSAYLQGSTTLNVALQNGTTVVLQTEGRTSGRQGHRVVKLALASAIRPDQQLTLSMVQDPTVSGHYALLDGSLSLPAGVLGASPVSVSISEGYWFEESRRGLGQFFGSLRYGPSLAGESQLQTDRFTVDVWLENASYLARVSDLKVIDDQVEALIPPMLLGWRQVGSMSSGRPAEHRPVRAWMETVELQAIEPLIETLAPADGVLLRWFTALSPRGTLSNIHLRHDGEGDLSFSADVQRLMLNGYRGVPTIVNGSARLWGNGRDVAARVNATDMQVGFPDLFPDAWFFQRVEGRLLLAARPGRLSVLGQDIRATREDVSITANFATSRPDERFEQRLNLTLDLNRANLEEARSYVPFRLNPGLRQWLLTATKASHFSDLRAAYHGQVHQAPEDRYSRRLELLGRFRDADIEYLPDWPLLTEASGDLYLSGRNSHIALARGQMRDIRVDEAEVRVFGDRGDITLDLETEVGAQSALDFIRNSPLIENLSFISPSWQGRGQLVVGADLVVPISINPEQTKTRRPVVDLVIEYSDLDLELPDYRLAFEALSGRNTFSMPHHLNGEMSGKSFGQPVDLKASSDDDWLFIEARGRLAASDLYAVVDLDDTGLLSGSADFSSRLALAMTESGSSRLRVDSDLLGLAVGLPVEFGKAADDATPTQLDLQFLDGYQRLNWSYRETSGWLHFADDAARSITGGAMGIRTAPSVASHNGGNILVSGRMPRLDIEAWVAEAGESAVAIPVSWEIDALQLEQLVAGDLTFDEVILSGKGDAEQMLFTLKSEQIIGDADLSDRSNLILDLDFLALPGSQDASNLESNLDPITLAVGRSMPRAQVNVAQLQIDEAPFGTWRFQLEPDVGGLRVELDRVSVLGLETARSALYWDFDRNITSFSGTVILDDLEQTLPKWAFPPTLTTTSATLGGNLSWPGSPANLNFLNSEGMLDFRATEGRFFDQDAGRAGLRMVSLLNVSALIKRINLDFSDVLEEGISFSELSGQLQVEDKELTFTENLVIKSTSSTYEIGGAVDLSTRTLDNEMIVTLPVSESLPWYAAYVALAQPIVGIGVAIGERIFRDPIQRMSSAKFSVTGSINEPQVRFLTLWDKDIEVANPAEQPSPDLLSEKESGELPEDESSGEEDATPESAEDAPSQKVVPE